MIETLLDACQFVLEDQGEPQSSYWLASQVMEMKLWRASEADVRDALKKDIEAHGERSRFLFVGDDVVACGRGPTIRPTRILQIIAGSFSFRQVGQYQGAGILTGFGLRLRHLAKSNAYPLRRFWAATSCRS